MSVAEPLPHWDLSNVYGGLEAEDYRRDFARLDVLFGDLAERFDAAGIGRLADPTWPAMDYVGQKPVETLSLHFYPGVAEPIHALRG